MDAKRLFYGCKKGDPQQPMEKVDPGNLKNRWAPYEKAHGLYQGQLPWRSLRSQEYVISCREVQNTPFTIKQFEIFC